MASHREVWKKSAVSKAAEAARETEDRLLTAQQSGVNPHDMLHALNAPQKASPKSVMMLQRAYGNRATARMLTQARARTPTAPVATVQPSLDGAYVIRREVVSQTQQELAPGGAVAYGWNYQYSVKFTANRCILTIKAKAVASPHPDTSDVASDAEMAKLKKDSIKQFAKIWDNVFLLVEADTKKKYSLRTELEFVDSGEDLGVEVYKGPGRDDLSHWYTGSDDGVTRAHELGHQMGLLDEYEDPGVENRRDSSASGVHEDHSVMGNYEVEGAAPAEAKLRHGVHIAKDISDATGRSFSALKPGKVAMFFRRLLR